MLSQTDQLCVDVSDDSMIARAFEAIQSALGGGLLKNAIIERETLHFSGIVAGLEQGFPNLADIELALERGGFLPDDLRVWSGREATDLHKFRFVNRGIVEPQMLANTKVH